MKSRSADVIVVGLGAMGSAAACHLAGRGASVIGLDRYTPPHALGSSHGRSRIIRSAYFEHPAYVPLVQRAQTLWTELEQEAGRRLLLRTGGLMLGPPDGVLVAGALRSAVEHGLAHEQLDAAAVRARFPALQPTDAMVGVWEPDAGVLLPEACIEAHLTLARRRGARLHVGAPVIGFAEEGEGVRVETSEGVYRASQVLLAAGAWITALVPSLAPVFSIERQVLYWFAPTSGNAQFLPGQCPIHLWEWAPRRFFYGFPELGDGVKLAVHHAGETADPERLRREVDADEVAAMRALAARFVPAANGALRAAEVCMYTNTADEHFWIDRLPGQPRVLVASPCSGHGFKFASVIGELLADLLLAGATRFDIELFRRR